MVALHNVISSICSNIYLYMILHIYNIIFKLFWISPSQPITVFNDCKWMQPKTISRIKNSWLLLEVINICNVIFFTQTHCIYFVSCCVHSPQYLCEHLFCCFLMDITRFSWAEGGCDMPSVPITQLAFHVLNSDAIPFWKGMHHGGIIAPYSSLAT